MSHHSKAQPAKDSAVNATAIQHEGDARDPRRDAKQPASLISPVALMALGLAGAATAGSPVRSTDQAGAANGAGQDAADAVNAAAVAPSDPLLAATSADAVAATTDSPENPLDIASDATLEIALNTPQLAEAVAMANLDTAISADLATTDAAPAADTAPAAGSAPATDGAPALTLKLDLPALPGAAAETPQLMAAASTEGSAGASAAAPAAPEAAATGLSAGQVVAALAGLAAIGAAAAKSSS